MLGIHMTLRRAAVIAAAALVAGSLSGQSARATAIPFSTGFETGDGFTSGMPVSTEDGFQVYDTGGSPSHASITGSMGSQVLTISRGAGEEIGASPVFTSNNSLSGNTVAVQSTVNYTATGAFQTAGAPSGPFFGIKVDAAGPSGTVYLGGFGVDATTGQLLVDDGSNTFNATPNSFANGQDVGGANNIFKITVTNTGSSVVLTDFYNGAQVDQITSIISSANATAFSEGYLFGGAAQSDTGSVAITGSANFDNYSVSDVPEPASLSVLGLAFIGLCGRRSRRNATVAL